MRHPTFDARLLSMKKLVELATVPGPADPIDLIDPDD